MCKYVRRGRGSQNREPLEINKRRQPGRTTDASRMCGRDGGTVGHTRRSGLEQLTSRHGSQTPKKLGKVNRRQASPSTKPQDTHARVCVCVCLRTGNKVAGVAGKNGDPPPGPCPHLPRIGKLVNTRRPKKKKKKRRSVLRVSLPNPEG